MSVTNLVSKFTTSTEDITDELTHTAGSVTTKVAPLMATVASGLSVLFAIYHGVGRLLEGSVPAPYTISAIVGAAVMLALEGASLAAVFNADRVRAINATRPADQQLKEGALPVWMLLLTMLIVLCTESIPAVFRYRAGAITSSDLAFAFGLLALPLLGRAGAVIFSTSAVLDKIDGANERRQKNKEQREQFSLDLEIKRKEAEQRLEIQRAEAAQKLEIERGKAAAKLAKGTSKGVSGSVSRSLSTTGGDTPETLPETARETVPADVLRHLMDHGDTGGTNIAKALGVSRATVYRYLDALLDEGKVRKVEKLGRPGQFTWEPILPEITPIPEVALVSTNGFGKH